MLFVFASWREEVREEVRSEGRSVDTRVLQDEETPAIRFAVSGD